MHDKPTLNLIKDPWLRVRRRSGRIESIQPWRITDDIRTDPVVACAWPRPDLNGAAVELLIGMLSTAGAAATEDEWSWGWIQPPGPEKLETTLGPMAPHFELVADGPAFLQDLDPLEDARISSPRPPALRHPRPGTPNGGTPTCSASASPTTPCCRCLRPRSRSTR